MSRLRYGILQISLSKERRSKSSFFYDIAHLGACYPEVANEFDLQAMGFEESDQSSRCDNPLYTVIGNLPIIESHPLEGLEPPSFK